MSTRCCVLIPTLAALTACASAPATHPDPMGATDRIGGAMLAGIAPTAPPAQEANRPLPADTILLEFGPRAATSHHDGDDHADVGPVVGLDYSHYFPSDLGLECGFSYSKHQELLNLGNSEEDLTVTDLRFGGRYAFVRGILTPYVGAGVAAVFIDGRGAEDTVAAYARLGLDVTIARHFVLGLDLRAAATPENEAQHFESLLIQIGWSF